MPRARRRRKRRIREGERWVAPVLAWHAATLAGLYPDGHTARMWASRARKWNACARRGAT